ncbi:hypothetical protein [Paraburkholderia aspalathi]|uniref:hypothetical protein n=1 Tax=Paraburkholderia aspalathi TaxID=1324617 RepID=UPI003C864FC8
MAMIQRSTKIPHNKRVPSKDAVIPGTQGIRTIIPSTLGIADRARFGKYVKAADALVHGLDAIIKIRNSDEAQQDPELKALANDPRVAKAIDRAINKLAAGVDSLVREYQATSTDDPVAIAEGRITGVDSDFAGLAESMRAVTTETRKRTEKIGHAVETAFEVMRRELAKGKTIEEARAAAREAVLSQHEESASAAGLDSGWHAFDADTIALREKAARRASELRHAANAVNPARVALGLADDADLDPIGTMQKLFGK